MNVKYLCIVFILYNDGTKPTASIYQYDSADQALQNFYKNMGKYVDVDNVDSVTVETKSSIGHILKNDAWVRPVVEPVEEV